MTSPVEKSVKPHGFVTKGIHWISVLMIGYGYVKGLESVNQLSDPVLLRREVMFASALGILFVLRLFWTQKIGGVTRLPAQAPKWEHIASRAVHYGLYGAVFGVVGTGLGIAYAFGSPGLGAWFMSAMLALHEVALTALPLLILMHIGGALWHKIIRRDGVMETMTGKLPMPSGRGRI